MAAMIADNIEVALQIPTVLGEGPLWSPRESLLYWLDVFKPTINRFDPIRKTNKIIEMREPIYALGLRAGGGFVASLESGFALLDTGGQIVQLLCNPNRGKNVNFNDGKVDRQGRFWSGTMARDWKSPIGSLHRLGWNGFSEEMDSGIILANGIAWSPDCRTMYFADFGRSSIYAYEFDPVLGSIRDRRTLIEFEERDGFPDGITVDAEGGLWVAHWDGWCVTRHDPSGKEILRLQFPVPRPTSVIFGGDDLRTLYVTSATMQLNDAELIRAPLSGALFAILADVRGLPEWEFGVTS